MQATETVMPRSDPSCRRGAAWLAVGVVFGLLGGLAHAGEKYALVVGVENYIPDQLPSLEYAEDDARAVGDALRSLGFSVISMTGDSPNPRHRSNTAERILEQVEKRLHDREPDDTIVLAFSGHGVQFKGDAEFYFCPSEAVLRDRGSLVPMNRVRRLVGESRAGRKLLLVDACRDELSPDAAAKGLAIELDPVSPIRGKPLAGTLEFYSCQERERSYEIRQFGHSVFTHHVLAYLTGQADASHYPRREVSVDALVPYVKAKTRESVDTLLGASQRPLAQSPEGIYADWSLGTLASVDRRPAMEKAAANRPLPALPPVPAAVTRPGEIMENSLGMKLVVIPAGEFQMGSDESLDQLKAAITASGIEWYPDTKITDERPVHRVRITKPFLMGQTEVTLGQFLNFYHDGFEGRLDCEKDGKGGWGYDPTNSDNPWDEKPKYRPWSWGFDGQTNDHPVVNVSWNDCAAFCGWLSRKEGKRYRLPTEAEWEYACRAGTTARYWFGEDCEKLADHDNVGDQTAKDRFKQWGYHITSRDGFAFSAPVGSYRRPNPFGLHDVHGNVAEWCSDWFDENYYAKSPAVDPKGPAVAGSFRVIRGGGWHFSPADCRSARRNYDPPPDRNDYVGFRVVCELE